MSSCPEGLCRCTNYFILYFTQEGGPLGDADPLFAGVKDASPALLEAVPIPEGCWHDLSAIQDSSFTDLDTNLVLHAEDSPCEVSDYHITVLLL